MRARPWAGDASTGRGVGPTPSVVPRLLEVVPLGDPGLRRSFAELLAALAEAARQHYGDNLVALAVFGSVARGTPGPESDVDVLVICRTLPRGHTRRVADFLRLEDRLTPVLEALRRRGIHTTLSPVIKTADEALQGSPLFLDMTHHVLVLHDPEGFLERLLSRLAGELAARGARRVEQGSRWYWDLGPGQPAEEGRP